MRSVREYIAHEIEGVEYFLAIVRLVGWAGVDPAGWKDRVLLTAWKESGRRIKLVGFGSWDRRWRFARVSLRRVWTVAINFLLRVWNVMDSWNGFRFVIWSRVMLRLFSFEYDEEVVFYFVVHTFSLLSSRKFVLIIDDSLLLDWKCEYISFKGDFKFRFFGCAVKKNRINIRF